MVTLKEGLWHHLPSEELLEQLGCHAERGLDPADAESRLGQFGPNRLTPKKAKGPIQRFLVQFHQPLVYILLAAGITTGLISEWSDATAIFAVVLVNAIIGFVQESKAMGAIEALSRAMTTSASVVRAAQPRLIPSEELVPGDIVTLQSGDKVPADMRLLRVRDLRIDESALTGESVAVEKAVGILDGKMVLTDRSNMTTRKDPGIDARFRTQGAGVDAPAASASVQPYFVRGAHSAYSHHWPHTDGSGLRSV